MKNASYLTDQYKDECRVWTPCLLDFFKKHQATEDSLRLPLHCRKDTNIPPWYVVEHGEFSIQGQWIRDTHGTELLRAIERFIKSRKNDKKIWETLNSLRWVEKSGMRCDIAGIKPDFLFLPRSGNVCYLVENKPFFSSDLTGNQIDNGDYINLANAINAQNQQFGIELKIIFMHPASWKNDGNLVRMNKNANGYVYSLLYESIFKEMAEKQFKYSLGNNGSTFGDWGQYTDLSKDV